MKTGSLYHLAAHQEEKLEAKRCIDYWWETGLTDELAIIHLCCKLVKVVPGLNSLVNLKHTEKEKYVSWDAALASSLACNLR